MKLLTFVVLILAGSSKIKKVAADCGENEEYSECTGCLKTCMEPAPQISCPCFPGCKCIEGYLYDDWGKCVLAEECPLPECYEFEEYKECGSPCPVNCENKDSPPSCADQCSAGCFCMEGYLKNDEGYCVLPENCPQKPLECSRENEIFSECGAHGCLNTCSEPYLAFYCDPAPGCFPGCICAENYFRDENGACVFLENCSFETECPDDEEWSECDAHSCLNTCDEPDLITRCTYSPGCYPGCICKEGYLRDYFGLCVPEENCPLLPSCAANEEYQTCGNTCPLTCVNMNDVSTCAEPCVPGCSCINGYVRDSNGLCVLPKDCPVEPPTCSNPNEFYNDCGKDCFLTCENKDLPPTCSDQCVPGCFCVEGYVRDSSGLCVLPKDCPVEPPTCSNPNEIFKECGTACPLTCENRDTPPLKCTKQCVADCFCINGYVRDSSGLCVLPKDCPVEPPTCSNPNEEWLECGTACPLTCENKDNPPLFCTFNCVADCFCVKDYVRDSSSGLCVLPKDCIIEPLECGDNEVYVECSYRCVEGTCNSKENRYCGLRCEQKCECITGYVRDDNNNCIKESDCPCKSKHCKSWCDDCVVG